MSSASRPKTQTSGAAAGPPTAPRTVRYAEPPPRSSEFTFPGRNADNPSPPPLPVVPYRPKPVTDRHDVDSGYGGSRYSYPPLPGGSGHPQGPWPDTTPGMTNTGAARPASYYGRASPPLYYNPNPLPAVSSEYPAGISGPGLSHSGIPVAYLTAGMPYEYFGGRAGQTPLPSYCTQPPGPPPGGIPPPGYHGFQGQPDPRPGGVPYFAYPDPFSWGAPPGSHMFYPGYVAPNGYCGPISRDTSQPEGYNSPNYPGFPENEVEYVLEESLVSERALNHLGLKYFRWDDRNFYLDDGITKEWKDRLITLTQRLRETDKLTVSSTDTNSYQAVYDTAQDPADFKVSTGYELIEDHDNEIEEFSRLRRIGNFRKANEHFEAHLGPRFNPYFVVLGAEMLLDMGHYRALKRLHSKYDRALHFREDYSSELLACNWDLIHLAAATRQQFFHANLLHRLQEIFLKLELTTGFFVEDALDSSKIRIVTHLLEIIANCDFEDDDDERDDWLRLYEALLDADWESITQRLFDAGRVWEFRDIFTHALPLFGKRTEAIFFGRPIPKLLDVLKRWQSDPQDSSTNLALLDIYNSVVFTLKPAWDSTQYTEISAACEEIISSLKGNPDNLSCRMYAEWSLLNVIYSAQRIRATGLLADGSAITSAATVEGSLLQIAPRDRDVLQMALSLSKELGDYQTQYKCLEIAVLVVGGADRARLIAETVRLKEVVQGVAFTGIDLTEDWPTSFTDQLTTTGHEEGIMVRAGRENMPDREEERDLPQSALGTSRRSRARSDKRLHLGPREQDDRLRLPPPPATSPSERRRLEARFTDRHPPGYQVPAHFPTITQRQRSRARPDAIYHDLPEETGSETVKGAATQPRPTGFVETISSDEPGNSDALAGGTLVVKPGPRQAKTGPAAPHILRKRSSISKRGLIEYGSSTAPQAPANGIRGPREIMEERQAKEAKQRAQRESMKRTREEDESDLSSGWSDHNPDIRETMAKILREEDQRQSRDDKKRQEKRYEVEESVKVLPNQSASRRGAERVRGEARDRPASAMGPTRSRVAYVESEEEPTRRPEPPRDTASSPGRRQRDQAYIEKLESLHRARSMALSTGAEPLREMRAPVRRRSFERVQSPRREAPPAPGVSNLTRTRLAMGDMGPPGYKVVHPSLSPSSHDLPRQREVEVKAKATEQTSQARDIRPQPKLWNFGMMPTMPYGEPTPPTSLEGTRMRRHDPPKGKEVDLAMHPNLGETQQSDPAPDDSTPRVGVDPVELSSLLVQASSPGQGPDASAAPTIPSNPGLEGHPKQLDMELEQLSKETVVGAWGDWGTAKSNEKKQEDGTAEVVEPAPEEEDDIWGFTTSKKTRKDLSGTTAVEPDSPRPSETEPVNVDDDLWGWPTSKKDKKKKGTLVDLEAEPGPPQGEDVDDPWGDWGISKKKKKRNKSAWVESETEDGPHLAGLGNLPDDVTTEDITNFLEGCDVTSVRLIEDRETQRPPGFARAEFANADGLKKALGMDGASLLNRNIKIAVAESPPPPPPEDDWAVWGTGVSKKDKKKKKKKAIVPEPEPEPAGEPAPEPTTAGSKSQLTGQALVDAVPSGSESPTSVIKYVPPSTGLPTSRVDVDSGLESPD